MLYYTEMGEKQYVAAQIDEDSPLYQQFEDYENSEGFESRSEAVRSLLRQGLDGGESGPSIGKWEMVAEQALYAVTFALMVAIISTVSFVVAVVLAGYPSPWSLISASVLVGSLLAATTGGLGYHYSESKINRRSMEVDR